ncbi:MAG: exopolysaccharide biosynthesis polyprenyl glycosylphosphotransferase [Arachidicoccus sp.]|nr:exopolysaccharide biosynthesis polyprenyl glycosylphosphotransferase [Arachidicoccus sp.]
MQNFFRNIKTNMLVLDLAILNISLFFASWIICGTRWIESVASISFAAFFNLIWVLFTFLGSAYEKFVILDSTIILKNTYKAYAAFFLCMGLFLLIISIKDAGAYNYFYFFVLFSVFFGTLLIWSRIVVLGLRKKYRDKIKPEKNIVVLGGRHIAERVYDSLQEGAVIYNILGIFSHIPIDPDRNEHPAHRLYKGGLTDCIDFIRTRRVQEVYCNIREFSPEQISLLVNESDKQLARVRFLLDYESIIKRPGKVTTYFGNLPVFTLRQEPLDDEINQLMKRTFDIIFSSLIIIFILSWLTPLLALLIRLESKGSPIFVQLRSGKDNKPFKCYKFRSMRLNNEAHTAQASKNDSRLTKIGSFMRKTNLDELPQFYNVLIGDMSVVGPRPHMLAHTKKYKKLLDSFMVRHLLKPGVTGWAQVNGYRGETKTLDAMENRVQYDIMYLENWSFFLDLKIIFLTVWNTVKGEEKAY